MNISGFITADFIKAGLESDDKDELFEEMIDVLVRNRGFDREALLSAVRDREAKMSTGIGQNIAIPHGKTDAVDGLCGVIGTSRSGIDYESLDDEPVHIVFLLLAPFDSSGPHIKALQRIAVLLKDRGFYKRLVDAGSAQELYQILVNEESRLDSEE